MSTGAASPPVDVNGLNAGAEGVDPVEVNGENTGVLSTGAASPPVDVNGLNGVDGAELLSGVSGGLLV